jgi:hypothetical protein
MPAAITALIEQDANGLFIVGLIGEQASLSLSRTSSLRGRGCFKVVEPSKKTNGNEPSQLPWILSAAYWNDVAKDVVKAASAALVIYLGGVVGGVFKIHFAILAIIVTVIVIISAMVFVGIFAIGKKTGKHHPGLASLICPLGGVGVAAFVSSNWHLASGWFVLICLGYGGIVLVISFWIIDHVLEK